MLHVLMVDDEPDLDLLIKQKFRKRVENGELSFIFARNGREALEVLEATPEIALVITDLNMPEINGIELLLRIRREHKDMPVIVISAYSDKDSITTAKNAGANDFLPKPFKLVELEEVINAYIPLP